jgi:hypothetical protein
MAKPKEPFIGQGDRPDVKIDPDKSVSDLTVRDLQSILGVSDRIIIKDKKDKDLDKYSWKEWWKEYAYEKPPSEKGGYPDFTPFADPARAGTAGLAEHIGGLHKKIDDLADQIAELKKSR